MRGGAPAVLLVLLLIAAAGAEGGDWLILGPSFRSALEAKRAVAEFRARALPAQFVSTGDYADLEPGAFAVAFGVAASREEAAAEAARLAERGVKAAPVRAGRYLGVAKSGLVRRETDRWILAAGPYPAAGPEAGAALSAFHARGLFPLAVEGRVYDNLDPGSRYLAFDEVKGEREGEELLREVYHDVEGLAVVRTGFRRGPGKDPLERLAGRLERAREFRKIREAADAARAAGDLGRALAGYHRALDLFPEHDATSYAIMKILLELGRLDEARAAVAVLRDRGATEELDYLDAYIRMKTVRGEALPAYRAFKALHPHSPYLPTLEALIPGIGE